MYAQENSQGFQQDPMVPQPDHGASAGSQIIFDIRQWNQPIKLNNNFLNALGTNSGAKLKAIAINFNMDFHQRMFLESSFQKHFSQWQTMNMDAQEYEVG